MRRVFADTSFYLLLLDRDEDRHVQAIEFGRSSEVIIVTSEFVLLELGNAMSRAADHSDFVDLARAIRRSPRTQVVPLSSALFESGVRLMESRLDKDWSLTDCISFEVMRSERLEEALTTDHHFIQAGFRALLR